MKENPDSKIKYSEDDITKMLEFLADKARGFFFVDKVFKQRVGIPLVHIANIHLFLYEAEFIQSMLSAEKKQ